MRGSYGRLRRSHSSLQKKFPHGSETWRTSPTFSGSSFDGSTSSRSLFTFSWPTSRKAGRPRSQQSWSFWLVWHHFLSSSNSCEDLGLFAKPALHPGIGMVSDVLKTWKRFGDIRYNGTRDTCAYFDFRGMASGFLSWNDFDCFFNCIESIIVLKCRLKLFVSTTRRCAP